MWIIGTGRGWSDLGCGVGRALGQGVGIREGKDWGWGQGRGEGGVEGREMWIMGWGWRDLWYGMGEGVGRMWEGMGGKFRKSVGIRYSEGWRWDMGKGGERVWGRGVYSLWGRVGLGKVKGRGRRQDGGRSYDGAWLGVRE